MAWLIQHKCFISQAEPSPYAVMKGSRAPIGNLTRVVCPSCKDEFVIVGHDMFREAQSDASSIPGFTVVRSPRSQ